MSGHGAQQLSAEAVKVGGQIHLRQAFGAAEVLMYRSQVKLALKSDVDRRLW
jgi:hypothetical protein